MKFSLYHKLVQKIQNARWLTAPLFFGQHPAVVEFLVRNYSRHSKKILDIGARRSPYTRSLQGLVVGIDLPSQDDSKLGFNYSSLQQFSNGHHFALFGSGECLPFKPDTFDVVIMIEVIEHIKEDRQALTEIHAVLKTDGILIISTPNGETFPKPAKYHIRHYRPEELKKLIDDLFNIKLFWPLFPKGKLWHESIKSLSDMLNQKDIISVIRHIFLVWVYWIVTGWCFFRTREKDTTTLFVVAQKGPS